MVQTYIEAMVSLLKQGDKERCPRLMCRYMKWFKESEIIPRCSSRPWTLNFLFPQRIPLRLLYSYMGLPRSLFNLNHAHAKLTPLLTPNYITVTIN